MNRSLVNQVTDQGIRPEATLLPTFQQLLRQNFKVKLGRNVQYSPPQPILLVDADSGAGEDWLGA